MPHFLKRNSGIFAIMSSSAGKAGVPYSGAYTGSKHALHVGYLKINSILQDLFRFWKKKSNGPLVEEQPLIFILYF